jgi:hypothetical protein
MSSKKLKKYMELELPSLAFQRKQKYRTDMKEVKHLFRLLNKTIFDNKLPEPKFIIFTRSRDYWGLCEAKDFTPALHTKHSDVTIHLSNKWFCKQWLIDVLAHEMCHQYQWDVYSRQRMKRGQEPIMSHGPSFYLFRDKLAEVGISLKRHHRMRKWFLHQNFFKC